MVTNAKLPIALSSCAIRHLKGSCNCCIEVIESLFQKVLHFLEFFHL